MQEVHLAWANSTTTKPSWFFVVDILESLVQYIERTSSMDTYQTILIYFKFSFGKEIKWKTSWKSPFWKILHTLKKYTKKLNLTLYYNWRICWNRKEIHNAPKSEIQFIISDQLFLDVLLMTNRSKTIAYATMKTRKTFE